MCFRAGGIPNKLYLGGIDDMVPFIFKQVVRLTPGVAILLPFEQAVRLKPGVAILLRSE